jgi:hypothetical protein
MTPVQLKHAVVVDYGLPAYLGVSPSFCSANNTDMTQLADIEISLNDDNGRLATSIAQQPYTVIAELCQHAYGTPVTLRGLTQILATNTNIVNFAGLAFDESQQVKNASMPQHIRIRTPCVVSSVRTTTTNNTYICCVDIYVQIYDAAGARQVHADFVVQFTATNGTDTFKSKLFISVRNTDSA